MSTASIRSLFLKSEKFFLFVSCRETQHCVLVTYIFFWIFLKIFVSLITMVQKFNFYFIRSGLILPSNMAIFATSWSLLWRHNEEKIRKIRFFEVFLCKIRARFFPLSYFLLLQMRWNLVCSFLRRLSSIFYKDLRI